MLDPHPLPRWENIIRFCAVIFCWNATNILVCWAAASRVA